MKKIHNSPSPLFDIVSSPSWTINRWGPSLLACTRSPDIKSSQLVSVIDLGSNSVKHEIFNRSQQSIEPIFESDSFPHLAAGMEPNEPKPHLNPTGLEILCDETLPSFKKQYERAGVDTVVIICTEAIRSVQHYNPAEVESLFKYASQKLGLPVQAFNVLSEDGEARLAAKTALIENPYEEYVVMQGGGSTEVARNPLGAVSPDFRATLRFGSQTLKDLSSAQALLTEELSSIPWFKPLSSSSYGAYGASNGHRGSICFLGGTLRPIGRLLAQQVNRIPFSTRSLYGGRRFLWNDDLKDYLTHLSNASPNQLNAEFYASPAAQQTETRKAWDKKIGRRADGISGGALTILTAAECTRPHEIVFANTNMRQATFLEFNN